MNLIKHAFSNCGTPNATDTRDIMYRYRALIFFKKMEIFRIKIKTSLKDIAPSRRFTTKFLCLILCHIHEMPLMDRAYRGADKSLPDQEGNKL